MRSVGVQELRQRLSELLRDVANGESLEVLDRGRVVAIVSPVPETSALAEMRAAGEVSRSSGSLDDLPEPLILPRGAPAPSHEMIRHRE